MKCIFLLSTVVDFDALPNPANGQVSHATGTKLGQTATYSCDQGYNLVGDSTRKCQATGMWSGSAPTCQCMLRSSHTVCKAFPSVYQYKLVEIPLSSFFPLLFSIIYTAMVAQFFV